MARPPKSTIPYFSHDSDASDGRTLTILENHFGLEGYAVWFKLLERISATSNQVIDCRSSTEAEFLAGKIRIAPDKLHAILDKLAELDAIDPQLWAEHRIIWCQKLVDRLGDVYKRRQQGPPQRPCPKTVSVDINLVSVDMAGTVMPQNDTETPQSKVKESKVKQQDPLTPKPPEPTAAAATEDSLGNVATLYEQNFGMLNPLIGDKLKDMLAEYGETLTRDALTEAGTQPASKRHLNYVAAILKRWAAEGRGPPGNNGNGRHPAKGHTRVPERYTRPEELDAEDGLTSHGRPAAHDRSPPVGR